MRGRRRPLLDHEAVADVEAASRELISGHVLKIDPRRLRTSSPRALARGVVVEDHVRRVHRHDRVEVVGVPGLVVTVDRRFQRRGRIPMLGPDRLGAHTWTLSRGRSAAPQAACSADPASRSAASFRDTPRASRFRRPPVVARSDPLGQLDQPGRRVHRAHRRRAGCPRRPRSSPSRRRRCGRAETTTPYCPEGLIVSDAARLGRGGVRARQRALRSCTSPDDPLDVPRRRTRNARRSLDAALLRFVGARKDPRGRIRRDGAQSFVPGDECSRAQWGRSGSTARTRLHISGLVGRLAIVSANSSVYRGRERRSASTDLGDAKPPD